MEDSDSNDVAGVKVTNANAAENGYKKVAAIQLVGRIYKYA